MKGTKDLFGEAYARKSDPPTSHKAANKMKRLGLAAKSERKACNPYWWPGNEDGLTCGEVCVITGGQWNAISPRFAPLIRKGYLQVKRDQFGICERIDPVSKTEQRILIRGLRRPEWDIYEDR